MVYLPVARIADDENGSVINAVSSWYIGVDKSGRA